MESWFWCPFRQSSTCSDPFSEYSACSLFLEPAQSSKHLPRGGPVYFGFRFLAVSFDSLVHDGLAPPRISCFAVQSYRSFLSSSFLSRSILTPSSQGSTAWAGPFALAVFCRSQSSLAAMQSAIDWIASAFLLVHDSHPGGLSLHAQQLPFRATAVSLRFAWAIALSATQADFDQVLVCWLGYGQSLGSVFAHFESHSSSEVTCSLKSTVGGGLGAAIRILQAHGSWFPLWLQLWVMFIHWEARSPHFRRFCSNYFQYCWFSEQCLRAWPGHLCWSSSCLISLSQAWPLRIHSLKGYWLSLMACGTTASQVGMLDAAT